MSSLSAVNFTLSSKASLTELSAACQKAIAANTLTVSVSRPCAEDLFNALVAAMKGPTPASKGKKAAKTSTSVRQKAGRPTGSSGRSGKGS